MKPLVQVVAIVETQIYTNHFPSELKQFEVTFLHTLMMISWLTLRMLIMFHSRTFRGEIIYIYKIYVGNSEI
jgi:hypothetical protein